MLASVAGPANGLLSDPGFSAAFQQVCGPIFPALRLCFACSVSLSGQPSTLSTRASTLLSLCFRLSFRQRQRSDSRRGARTEGPSHDRSAQQATSPALVDGQARPATRITRRSAMHGRSRPVDRRRRRPRTQGAVPRLPAALVVRQGGVGNARRRGHVGGRLHPEPGPRAQIRDAAASVVGHPQRVRRQARPCITRSRGDGRRIDVAAAEGWLDSPTNDLGAVGDEWLATFERAGRVRAQSPEDGLLSTMSALDGPDFDSARIDGGCTTASTVRRRPGRRFG
jgi:hypothetical protein